MYVGVCGGGDECVCVEGEGRCEELWVEFVCV